MAKVLIIISTILFIALIVIGGFLSGIIHLPGGESVATENVIIEPVNSDNQKTEAATSSESSPPQVQNPSAASTGEVTFDFAIIAIQGSGLTRTVTARLGNVGTSDAHNVWAKIEAFSGNSVINLNGQPFLRVDIGTLEAGKSVTEQIDLGFSIVDGIKISQNGVRLNLTIISEEHSETYSYNYTL